LRTQQEEVAFSIPQSFFLGLIIFGDKAGFGAATLAPCFLDTFLRHPVDSSLGLSRERNWMLLSRDFVGYMAAEISKRLIDNEMIEAEAPAVLTDRIRQKISEELGVEDRLNEEVREILNQHADEMRRTGASYQEMYKKVKGELARQRKLILR
jgi:hypothetical protein